MLDGLEFNQAGCQHLVMDMTPKGSLIYINILLINMWGPKAKERRSWALSTGLKDGRMKGGRPGTSISPKCRIPICNLTPMVDRTFKYMHKVHCSNDDKSPHCNRQQGDMCPELSRS